MLTTWKFRIKDSGSTGRVLARMARSVSFSWNFCKDTQVTALRRSSTKKIQNKKTGIEKLVGNFFSAFELNNLTAGSGKELGLHSQTVQAVCEEYARRRDQFGKLLRWRGRHSPGWVPFKAVGIEIGEGSFRYCKREFEFWSSRKLPEDAKVKTGSFNQDKRGRWYLCVTFESESLALERWGDRKVVTQEVGVDLGIKMLATLSTGEKIERPNLRTNALEQIRKLEKTRRFARKQQSRNKKFVQLPKEKKLKKLHAKVANQRQEYLHQASTKLVKESRVIVMGDLRCALMNRSRNMSGISLDSGIGMFRQMVRYKADRAGVTYVEVSERDSTQTCSSCGWRHPSKTRIGLGVREWRCAGCGDQHDRDINAARNILRIGRDTLTRQAA